MFYEDVIIKILLLQVIIITFNSQILYTNEVSSNSESFLLY